MDPNAQLRNAPEGIVANAVRQSLEFKSCEGLSRVAFMDGNGVVMLGKVISCERKDDKDAAAGKKK